LHYRRASPATGSSLAFWSATNAFEARDILHQALGGQAKES